PRAKAAVGRAGMTVAFPVAWRYMSRRYDFNQADYERSCDVIRDALDRIEAERGGRDHLVGDSFTVADLTAAALLYPLAWPPAFRAPLPERPPTPFFDPVRDPPAVEWVGETWRRHRPASAAL